MSCGETKGDNYMCMCVPRCEPVGGHREWFETLGSQRSGQGLPPHQLPKVPADGRPGGAQPAHHHIRFLLQLITSLLKAVCAVGIRP